jgi:hypothetical protein
LHFGNAKPDPYQKHNLNIICYTEEHVKNFSSQDVRKCPDNITVQEDPFILWTESKNLIMEVHWCYNMRYIFRVTAVKMFSVSPNIQLLDVTKTHVVVHGRIWGTKRHIFVSLYHKLPKTVTKSIYNADDCCSQRGKVPVMFSVLPYSTHTVQILYKL